MCAFPVRSLSMKLYPSSTILLLVGGLLMFSGCFSAKQHIPDSKTDLSPQRPDGLFTSAPNDTLMQQARSDLLRQEANFWAGTPHVWGGATKNGVDCSALVQQVYDNVFDVALPRTTAQQSRLGELVSIRRLEVGDLIFYKIDRSTRHVGIYMGNNEFFHASKSQGVTISSLDAPYWRKRFWKVKRILPPEPQLTSADEVIEPRDQKRKGW